MARTDTVQADILERILVRLRVKLGLNDRTCFEVLAPDQPNMVPGGDFFVTVSPGGGQFEQGEQARSGFGTLANVTEYSDAVVTAYCRIRLDSTGHDQYLLRDARRGLLFLKKQILSVLVGQDVVLDTGDTVLRQTLYVRGVEAPKMLQDSSAGTYLGAISITFGVDFDWDLTADLNNP